MASNSGDPPTIPPVRRRQTSLSSVPHVIPNATAFLPVTAEAAVPISPRGQRLSQILQSHVAGARAAASRRISTSRFEGEDLERGERVVPRPAAGRLRERSQSAGVTPRVETGHGEGDKSTGEDGTGGIAQVDGPAYRVSLPTEMLLHELPDPNGDTGSSSILASHALDTPTMRSQRVRGACVVEMRANEVPF